MTIGTLSYPDLLQTYAPRPITTEVRYDAIVAQMNLMIDKGELSLDEQDFLTLLGTLVAAYEKDHYPDEAFELRGVELVKALMAEAGLRQKDLIPIFKTKSIASAVLSGKRRLTVEHINRLATFFNMPHEAFFEAVGVETAVQ
jgi:HTH-type transcriptional regulator/antitoxin HigA